MTPIELVMLKQEINKIPENYNFILESHPTGYTHKEIASFIFCGVKYYVWGTFYRNNYHSISIIFMNGEFLETLIQYNMNFLNSELLLESIKSLFTKKLNLLFDGSGNPRERFYPLKITFTS